MEIISTERLSLREFSRDDTAFILQLLNSLGWLQFIGDRNVHSEEDALNYLRNGPMKSYEINGFGLMHVSLNSDGTPIGMCGLLKRDNLDDPDIGFALLPEFGKKGYAQEMAEATLNYGKRQLKMARIVAITMQENEHSIALLTKIGFRFEKNVLMPNNETLMLFANEAG